MSKHTISDLYQMQGMSLENKVKMTKRRIQEWVEAYGLDGVYVSFSGGKDSTVLLTIARELYPEIRGVFVDTGLEYPEIRQFVKTWDNIDWVKPKMTFRQVIEKYGYPFISKEVAECVYGARKYLTSVIEEMERLDRQTDRQTDRQARSGDSNVRADCLDAESTQDLAEIVGKATMSHKLYVGGKRTSTANSEASVCIPVGKTYSDRQIWEAVKRAEMSQIGGRVRQQI